MIHEVLLSLWHCPGELFKATGEDEWISSMELKEFLHPGEHKLLQGIMRISITYHKIEEFRTSVANRHTIQYENDGNEDDPNGGDETSSGLYLKAFCNGLDDVLDDYRREIVDVETAILSNPQLTLSYVYWAVEKYGTVLDAVKSFVRTIRTERTYGCLLIGRLHAYLECGIPQIHAAADRIVKSINKIFYRDLANWIVYGYLEDVHGEFFIYDCKCDDENFLFPEQIEVGQNEADQSSSIQKKVGKFRNPCRVRKFTIRPEMLPSTIPRETAETILFMGRIVWILRNDPKQTCDVLKEKFYRDMWEGQGVEYYKKIQRLEERSFNLALFERNVGECRVKLTKYLWGVMVQEANLLDHLQLIRDYYCLGRGELFQQFIFVVEEQLRHTPADCVAKNFNLIFSETARKIYSENDRSYAKFELVRNVDSRDAVNPLLNLEIYLDVAWPLHMIFHPKVLALYNRVFGFLLRVKKTHIDLHLLWADHIRGKKKIDRGVWTLRHNLMFLVNNIQYYLQVDVIEAQFSILQESIQNVNEFNDVIRLHSKFLSNLLSKTFVMVVDDKANENEKRHGLYQLPSVDFDSKNKVYQIILLLLELCDEFCVMAATWDVTPTEPEREELEQFQGRTNVLVETLLRALFSLHSQVSGHHLLQLLHRLDFNRWYTKSKPDLNLTAS